MTPELGFVHCYEPGSARATLLLLHGTGGNEHSLVELARQMAPAANLLSPRGKVLENGAPRFFRRLAMGVFDQADLMAQAANLARFVQEAAERYGFDAGRVYALGYSNGANMAAALMLLHPEALAGACCSARCCPWSLLAHPAFPAKPLSWPRAVATPGLLLSAWRPWRAGLSGPAPRLSCAGRRPAMSCTRRSWRPPRGGWPGVWMSRGWVWSALKPQGRTQNVFNHLKHPCSKAQGVP
ncbi:alpha/beta hydrolase [Meiothermus ruber]|uniref:Phospholipase/Carboxylesterase n=1 Tax=Meiothermus ruber (strain ATCC 35948 / DSM 1279 / VKM B-1258 / 21) TaxID=504728 RepID=M9XD60_MEIRD|nr:phospholipase/carboxylesterase [Meiothermus ruber]AGK04513.1 phospholipase/Carboxylesterase [Meiothermus ruber DSM 1279]